MASTSTDQPKPNGTDAGSDVLLRIYSNDHRAGAAGGLALARRSERANHGSPLGAVLETLVAQLEVDARTLDRIMRELHVRENPWKRTAALAGEVLGRLKLNGRLRGYSPLSRVLELELLMAGIDAKRSLWRSLGSTCAERLPDVDFDDLIHRAGEQRAMLRPYHRESARAAFGNGT